MFDDLTDEERARLPQSELRMGRVLSQSDIELYLFDAETYRCLQASEGATKSVGFTMSELRDMTPWDLQQEFDEQSFVALLRPLRDGTQSVLTVEASHQRKDGTVYPVSVRLQLMAKETPAVLLAMVQDITEYRKMSEQLRLSQRLEAVGVLAGGLAHDFNNLLTAIKGHAELALGDLTKELSPEEHFGVIAHAADRGAALVRQLLAFSRQQVLRPKVVSLNDVVHRLEPLLRSTLGEDVILDLDLDPSLGTVRVDPGQMEEILLNLTINARDAMRRGGLFSVETRNRRLDDMEIDGAVQVIPGDYVIISVSDTGVGMDEEVRRRAFEPFFTTKGLDRGTGLGLAMIYGIVKQSGGYIWLESEVGSGTTFFIALPRVEAKAEAEPPFKVLPPTPVGEASETIVLVEDDALVRELLESTLEAEGYRVYTAASGEEALDQHGDLESVDLLLSDVVMPGLSGPDLAREFAKDRPDLKVLLVSGYAAEKLRKGGVETLRQPLLEKPFSPAQLLRAVREALDSGLDSAT